MLREKDIILSDSKLICSAFSYVINFDHKHGNQREKEHLSSVKHLNKTSKSSKQP